MDSSAFDRLYRGQVLAWLLGLVLGAGVWEFIKFVFHHLHFSWG